MNTSLSRGRMRRLLTILLLEMLFTIFTVCCFADELAQIKRGGNDVEKYIAHAGGIVYGLTYTNSVQALDESYNNGFKLIELDFSWTSDDDLALIHDWGQVVKLFNSANKVYSSLEFTQLIMTNGLSQMTLAGLVNWLLQHPDVYIVTDIKDKNIDGLRLIAKKYPFLIRQMIPQIYQFEEYDRAVRLGYKHVILTLYRSSYSENELLLFTKKHKLFAITMPIKTAMNTQIASKLNNAGHRVYVHTVNSPELAKTLMDSSVYGVYTDSLSPNKAGTKSQINQSASKQLTK